MPGVAKFLETESRMLVAGTGGEGNGAFVFNMYSLSLG